MATMDSWPTNEKPDEIQDIALQRWVQERDVKTKGLYCRQMPWDRLYRKDLAYFTLFGGGGGVTVAYGTTTKVSWPVVCVDVRY